MGLRPARNDEAALLSGDDADDDDFTAEYDDMDDRLS